MAVDEAISEAVRKKLSPPTLRLYEWIEPSITIGYFQKASDINLSYCKERSYPITRRITGGKAILHDSELTYSFSASKDTVPFKEGLLKNYLHISNALVLALKLINLNAKINILRGNRERNPYCFRTTSYGEIKIDDKKIIGSAQKRYINGFLQQGSILIDCDIKELSKVLGGNNNEDFHKIGTIKKFIPNFKTEELRMAIIDAFEKTFSIRFVRDNLSDFELTLARQLEDKKYSASEWNFRI